MAKLTKMRPRSQSTEPGRGSSTLPTGDQPSQHSTKRAAGMQGRSKADKPKAKTNSMAGISAKDAVTTNAASRDQLPKSRAHEPGIHAGSKMETSFTEDSFDAGRTAGVDSMGSKATESKSLNEAHTSHDGSRSTDAGRTVKMADRGKWDEPAQRTEVPYTQTGHRQKHPGVKGSKTAKMVAHTDEHRPASY